MTSPAEERRGADPGPPLPGSPPRSIPAPFSLDVRNQNRYLLFCLIRHRLVCPTHMPPVESASPFRRIRDQRLDLLEQRDLISSEKWSLLPFTTSQARSSARFSSMTRAKAKVLRPSGRYRDRVPLSTHTWGRCAGVPASCLFPDPRPKADRGTCPDSGILSQRC